MSNPQTPLDVAIAYYSALLVIQFRTKPKATATMQILSKQAVADMFILQVQSMYDLATAIGVQLDILGAYIGVNRNSNTPASVTFFAYDDASGGTNPNHGYNDTTAASLNGYLFADVTGANLPTTAFTDLQYQFVLQLQIALNNFDGTLAYIQDYLAEFFPGEITVVDNLNMSLTYNIAAGVTLPISNTVLENFLPRPMGCGISIVQLEGSFTRVTTDSSTPTRVTTDGNTRVTV